jgi:cobalamin biosynthesis Mg chelatase CobN
MGGNDPAALRDAAVAAMRAAATGDAQQADAARTRAAEAMAKAQNIPVEEARNQVRQYEQQYREAVEATKREATEAAAAATKAVSRGALIGALSLLLGAVAAWFGGRMGAVDPTITASVRTGPAMGRT